MFGLYVKFTAQEGQRDTLAAHLLRAAEFVRSLEGCYLYVINRASADAVTVWVTEVWQDETTQQASLELDVVRAMINDVLPLLAGPPERIELVPLGGKGLPLLPEE